MKKAIGLLIVLLCTTAIGGVYYVSGHWDVSRCEVCNCEIAKWKEGTFEEYTSSMSWDPEFVETPKGVSRLNTYHYRLNLCPGCDKTYAKEIDKLLKDWLKKQHEIRAKDRHVNCVKANERRRANIERQIESLRLQLEGKDVIFFFHEPGDWTWATDVTDTIDCNDATIELIYD